MKSKTQSHVCSRERYAPRDPADFGQARTDDEILKFFQAVDSYSLRIATEPSVTFHQHLRSIFLPHGPGRAGGSRP